MAKKALALTMALVLCMSVSVAFAAGSKTVQNVVKTDTAAIVVTAQTADSQAELDAIAELVEGGAPVSQYFDEAVQQEIQAALPEGVDETTLKLDELFPLAATGEIDVTTASVVTLATAAAYKDGDAVVVLGGHKTDSGVVWQRLDATISGGKLQVTLPPAFLAHVANGNAMIIVLSNAQQ